MFFSRSSVRMSELKVSSRLSTAARMSTCSRKCTPPRRSRPRYIGSACSAFSHVGVFEIRFSATTYAGSSGFGFSARWIASLACSWTSVSRNRARTVEFRPAVSKNTPVVSNLASFRIVSIRAISAASTLIVGLPDDTCTAGDSPKKFGSV